MRRRLLVIAAAAVVLVAALATAGVLALRGDGDKASDEPIEVTRPASSQALYASGGVATPEPIARLPGITVIGSGDVEVKPDTALIRLTVGSGSAFDGPDRTVKLVDEKKLEPIVEALVDAGAPEDDVYVNTFGGSTFGPDEDAAVIVVEWPRPRDVHAVLAAAQRAIRKKTDFDLQAVAVAFARDDCAGPEEKAMRAALADARERAARLASLSHAKLGRLVAVSEAPSGGALSLFAPKGCGVPELSTPGLFEYQSAAASADKITVTSTLEVTFALER